MAEKKLSEELEDCLEGKCEDCIYHEPETKLTCRRLLQKAYEVIKRYEELEKQCNEENSWGLRMLLYKWKEFIGDIHELYEYRKLEEQERLLKLPCKVGDMLYILTEDSPTGFEETKCQSIVFYSKSNFVVYAPYQYDDWGNAKWKLKRKDFGKTAFLTKLEAEQALEERQS